MLNYSAMPHYKKMLGSVCLGHFIELFVIFFKQVPCIFLPKCWIQLVGLFYWVIFLFFKSTGESGSQLDSSFFVYILFHL